MLLLLPQQLHHVCCPKKAIPAGRPDAPGATPGECPPSQRRLRHLTECLRPACCSSSSSTASGDNSSGSSVPGEGINLIGSSTAVGTSSFRAEGMRTGAAALRVSLGADNLVTSAHPLASMAGARVLLAGGNAFDATLAVAATLNVTEPMSSGMAGNGFSTVFDASTGLVHSLAMTGAAPRALVPDSMTEAELQMGYRASCAPGNLAGYLELIRRHGTMSLAETLAHAIEYSVEGHPAGEALCAAIAASERVLSRYPTSAALFLPHGRPPKVGERWRNPGLGKTMRRLVAAEREALDGGSSREEGIEAAARLFYEGDLAAEICAFHNQHDGLLSMADMAAVAPRWSAPIHINYRGYDVHSNPATTRGGLETLMQLNLLEGWDVSAIGRGSARLLHLQAECIKVAKSSIYHFVGDRVAAGSSDDDDGAGGADAPEAGYSRRLHAGLLSKSFAAHRRALIDESIAMAITPEPGDPLAFAGCNHPARSSPSASASAVSASAASAAAVPAGRLRRSEAYHDSQDTTSFSVLDHWGNAVCCTPTIGEGFGTRVVCGDTGLIFNNGMRIGSTSPYPESVNYVHPGRTALLNNSPIVVTKDGELVLTLGTPGGEVIGQSQFQTLVNILDFGMPIQEAIEAPRFKLTAQPNFYKPRSIKMSIESRFSAAATRELQSLGHKV
jgi:gamma-glutamyltranspeptidase/glutathione hydrolase